MIRREALKSLAALPFVKLKFNGHEVDAVKVEPHAQYVIFADPIAFNFDVLERSEIGPDDALRDSFWFPVRLMAGRTLQDVLAIYKLEAGEDITPEAKSECFIFRGFSS